MSARTKMALSTEAQALAAGYWGLSPKLELTLGNRQSRLTLRAANALDELIAAGIVEKFVPDDCNSTSLGYRLTEAGLGIRLAKSLEWMEKHGGQSLTEPAIWATPTPQGGCND